LRTFGCLLVLVVAAGIGLFLYKSDLTRVAPESSPDEEIAAVGVQMDLIGIARAQKVYVIGHGRYGTLRELAAAGHVGFQPENRHGYNYEAEIDGDRHFRITARPINPNANWPVFVVDETMQVVRLR